MHALRVVGKAPHPTEIRFPLTRVPCLLSTHRHAAGKMKWYDRDAALLTAAGACAGIALPLLAAPEQVGGRVAVGLETCMAK
jgi:hypothetical protein